MRLAGEVAGGELREGLGKGEYAGMYADIDAGSRHSTSAGEFAEAYEKALTTATASGMRVRGHRAPRRAV